MTCCYKYIAVSDQVVPFALAPDAQNGPLLLYHVYLKGECHRWDA